MKTPQISVIIPYYEGGKRLSLSLASVMRQSGALWEIIIVDDGSVHTAAESVLSFSGERIKLIKKCHGGKASAVNEGIKHAEADIICVLDQDDIMADGRLARQTGYLAGHPAADAVYSDYERIGEDGSLIDTFTSRQADAGELLHALAYGLSFVTMQTLSMRRVCFAKTGGFFEDDSITGFDDAEFLTRLLAFGLRLEYAPGVAGKWVSHAGNYSKTEKFNQSRMNFLRRLDALAPDFPVLRKELGFFRFHNHFMSGIYFLEHGRPKEAIDGFFNALKARPFVLNNYYLLAKSALLRIVRAE